MKIRVGPGLILYSVLLAAVSTTGCHPAGSPRVGQPAASPVVEVNRPAADAWTMAGRDAGRTRASQVTVKPPLRERWRTRINGTNAVSPCLVNGDHVYAIAADKPGANEGRTSLIALNSRTGKIEWRVVLPGRHYALPSPVLYGSRIFVLDALQVHDQLVWIDAPSGAAHGAMLPRPPKNYYEAGSAFEFAPLPIDGTLVALNAEGAYSLTDGRPKWSAKGGRLWSEGIGAAFVVGRLFASGGVERDFFTLLLNDPKTGRMVQKVSLGGGAWGTDDSVVGACATPDHTLAILSLYSEEDGSAETVAVDPGGTIRWTAQGQVSLGIVANGRLFCLMTGGRESSQTTVAALSVTDGKPLWHTKLTKADSSGLLPVLAGEALWLATDSGLTALSASTGDKLGESRADLSSNMIASNGVIYATAYGQPAQDQVPLSVVALEHDPAAGGQ